MYTAYDQIEKVGKIYNQEKDRSFANREFEISFGEESFSTIMEEKDTPKENPLMTKLLEQAALQEQAESRFQANQPETTPPVKDVIVENNKKQGNY